MTSYLEELLPNENSLGWKLLNWIEENKEGSATDIHQILTQRKVKKLHSSQFIILTLIYRLFYFYQLK
jgi:hypothetical protein